MSYILIPQIVTKDSAMIWVGAVDEKVRQLSVYLEYNETNKKERLPHVKLARSEWRNWKTRHPLEKADETTTVKSLHYQRVTIPLPKSFTKYTVRLLVGEPNESVSEMQPANMQDYSKSIGKEASEPVEIVESITKATVTSLPEKIPAKTEKPFTVLLGSCFYINRDKDGLVGQTFYNLPENSRPDIKFLCGDQVYLDNPWKETTIRLFYLTSPKENMRALFFEKYLTTWTQIKTLETGEINSKNNKPETRPVGGFNLLLRHGANYFCSDDHEYWNNAPNFGGVGAILTFFRFQKRWWFREASELFRVFQSLAPWMTFNVEPVSFCVADTRINRTTHKIFGEDAEARFMEDDDLEAIGEWIKNLKGPGVLVLGQLLLTDKADWAKTFKNLKGVNFFTRLKESFSDYFDFGLPDFEKQYDQLIGYIQEAKHSIVLLTGDIHFGRIAVCKVKPGSDVDFIEIISSPMSVVEVDETHPGFGTYEDAPVKFGTKVESEPIACTDDFQRTAQNHFTTLEFSRADTNDGKIEMKIKAWKIEENLRSVDDKSEAVPIDVKTVILQ